MSDNKNKITQQIINIGTILIIAAYGFIFNGILNNIQENETNIGNCFTRIEMLNPQFMQIQADLSEIKADLKWLKIQK